MKFVCDVHISRRLVNYLDGRGASAIHVNDILEQWHTADEDLARYADDNDCILVTKDSDFRESHFLSGTPRKVLRVGLGNIPNDELISIIAGQFENLQTIFQTERCYVEVNRHGWMVVR